MVCLGELEKAKESIKGITIGALKVDEILNLGKEYGDKQGLGYVNGKITPSPSNTTFDYSISKVQQQVQGKISKTLARKVPTKQPKAQGKTTKALLKQSKSQVKSTQVLMYQPKPRQPINNTHALEKASISYGKTTYTKRGDQMKHII
ncbi:hypothetical protein ACOSP7_019187 [Xanthoceras sorbifolium]